MAAIGGPSPYGVSDCGRHVGNRSSRSGPPGAHFLTVDLGRFIPVKGLTLLSREDRSNGRTDHYEVYFSSNGETWQGRSPNSGITKTASFFRANGPSHTSLGQRPRAGSSRESGGLKARPMQGQRTTPQHPSRLEIPRLERQPPDHKQRHIQPPEERIALHDLRP
ncbi:MAG: discoidin domain-containing protein [Verrucomicrobiaceae bacterium]|nr:MAG: discoidin domain-containing protein [Verrucomicrobiaceae bacterium]